MQSLDERCLRYLAEAVGCGSVRAAADKLNVNASAAAADRLRKVAQAAFVEALHRTSSLPTHRVRCRQGVRQAGVEQNGTGRYFALTCRQRTRWVGREDVRCR
jgi:hypothetical protein